MKNKKLVIFDMDGTILNTLDDLYLCTVYALESCGYPAVDKNTVRKFTGRGVRFMVKNCMPDGTTDREFESVISAFLPYYGEHCDDHTRPYPDVCRVIEKLRARGYKTAVLSNKIGFAVEDLCEKHFDGLFDDILGQTDGLKPKPEPDGIIKILGDLNVKKEDAVLVGDSDIDILTGYNADIDVIGVDWGFREREILTGLGVKTIVSRPEELLSVL